MTSASSGLPNCCFDGNYSVATVIGGVTGPSLRGAKRRSNPDREGLLLDCFARSHERLARNDGRARNDGGFETASVTCCFDYSVTAVKNGPQITQIFRFFVRECTRICAIHGDANTR
ncbi:MAG: hypothetical protein LBT00_09790 [Spirochaetaceae bacterium]|nr:hypothetical protein [Spirochaetaceae bacterium]